MAEVHTILWKKGEAAGNTDVFLVEDLKADHKRDVLTHVVWGPGKKNYFARCRVTTHGTTATLDYRDFKTFNKRDEMELGVMRLEFADAKRRSVRNVYWEGELFDAKWVDVKTQSTKRPATASDVAAERIYEFASRLRRQGQVAFRRSLQEAYGSKCCISDCDLVEALAAAHIAPYSKHLSSAPSSGLLLRLDLHALWDSGHLSVDPAGRARFSKEARMNADYEKLHGRKLRKPGKETKHSSPDTGLLRQHWKEFEKAQA